MKGLEQQLEEIFPQVTKPTRYLGTEWNSVHKSWEHIPLRMAFAFPDVYEVGMSHLGLRILYHLVNEREDMLCERVFAPWPDMEEKMRQRGIPLFSLESRRPLADFQVVGFTLQYEMSYSNILNMLDLGGIPLRAAERREEDPLIMAGGPCAFNPEPLADFIDFFVIGEGEEILLEILDIIKERKGRMVRRDLLMELARVSGVYVPSLYRVVYGPGDKIAKVEPLAPGVPERVYKRVVKDLNRAYFPDKVIVPFMEIIHDRVMLEVLRGCSRGCRFCQAGMIYRPVRERDPRLLQEQAACLEEATGYDEISLTSLSTSDYSCVGPLLQEMVKTYGPQWIGLSLPSLRLDSFSVNLAKAVQRVRKTGLTFAPEGGTQRLRDVINKGVTEKDLEEAVTAAFAAGWTQVKLYFMIGLPTETQEDVEGIALLAEKVVRLGEQARRQRGGGKGIKVTVSTSSFVPKPHTPFQWEGQMPMEELEAKQEFLKKRLKDRRISYSWHDARISFMEAVFARGDRRLNKVLEEAWRLGCKFDGWSEHFRFDLWLQAFAAAGLDPEAYAHRSYAPEEILPWDHIQTGVSKEYLLEEHRKAMQGKTTGDCRFVPCEDCGVCPELGAQVDIHRSLAGRKGGDEDAAPADEVR